MTSLSVVIPVFNTAAYVGACVGALQQQTLAEEWECLWVDDHGTDDSMDQVYRCLLAAGATPCSAPAGAGQRAPLALGQACHRFLSTPRNGGPGAARNVGIEAAVGDYIALVDSDDTIAPQMLAVMLQAARKAEADLCYCQLHYSGGRHDKKTDGNPHMTAGPLSDEARRKWLVTMKTFCWTFLYRRTFLTGEGLSFPARRSAEDSNFLIKCILLARRVACVDEPLYGYCLRPSSLTTAVNPRRYAERTAAFVALLDEARARGVYDTYGDELDFVFLKKAFAVGMMDYLRQTDRVEAAVVDDLRAAVDVYVPRWRRNPYLRRQWKAGLAIALCHALPLWALCALRPLCRTLTSD